MFQAVINRIALKAGGFEVVNIESYVPADVFNFSVDLELTISLEGQGNASERFNIEICTPSWVENSLKQEGCIIGSGRLLVRCYSYEVIRIFIDRYIKSCRGKTVDDVLRRVGLLGDWESEWEI